jgi:hypothetical protein
MAAEAGSIYKAALQGGINPALVVGIAGAESSFGTKGYAIGKNNPFGLMGFSFPNYTAATRKLAQTLNNTGLGYPGAYKRGGLNAMIQIYTPRGAANGPNNDPDGHTRNIINIGRRTGGDASQAYVKNGRALAGGVADTGTAAPQGQDGGGGVASGAMTGYSIGPEVLSKIVTYMNSARQSIEEGKDVLSPTGHTDVMQQILSAIPSASSLAAATGTPTDTASPVAGSPYTGGSIATGANYSGAPGQAPMTRGQFAYPLGRKGTFGGGPGGGTHSFTSGPNNWQSDNAVDFMVPEGTPVYAVAGGRIGPNFGSLNSSNPRMAGLRMTVVGGPQRATYYSHLSQFAPGIRPGVTVRRGQLLGYSGSANGAAHLHLGFQSGDPRILTR